jgi:hypothetical protein
VSNRIEKRAHYTLPRIAGHALRQRIPATSAPRPDAAAGLNAADAPRQNRHEQGPHRELREPLDRERVRADLVSADRRPNTVRSVQNSRDISLAINLHDVSAARVGGPQR